MSDQHYLPLDHPKDLPRMALLYASGLLQPLDAAVFEKHLAESQEARDLLVAAVSEVCGDSPDPGASALSYRNTVMEQARQVHEPVMAKYFPSFRSLQPLFWGTIGVVIGCLFMNQWQSTSLPKDMPSPPSYALLAAAPTDSLLDDRNVEPSLLEEAVRIWLSMRRPSSLQRSLDEFERRRVEQRDLHRLRGLEPFPMGDS